MSILFGLVTSSIVGSVIFLTLLLLRPVTVRIFSKTWHYYCLIVPLVFLLGGTHVAINLAGFMPAGPASIYSSPTLTSQETPMGIPYGFTAPEVPNIPVLNVVLNIPALLALDEEIYAGLAQHFAQHFANQASQALQYLARATPFLLTLWIVGAIMFIAINTAKYLKYRRTVLHSAKSVTGFDLGCKMPIEIPIEMPIEIPVVTSAVAHIPMLIGVIKPTIVLPDMHFTYEELDMILAHEMVHYRRKDLLVKLLMLIANAVHWFNPIVYALNRGLNSLCELSCDEKVVSKMDMQNRRYYGETILRVLKNSTGSLVGNVAFATNLCSSKKNFKRRLISMMNTKKMRKSIVALAFAAGILVVAGGFVVADLIGSAMPVYAQEVDSDTAVDTTSDVGVQNDIPGAPTVQPTTPPAEASAETPVEPHYATIGGGFMWPLGGDRWIVTTPFGMMINPITGREEFHTGIDIAAPEGTPIYAAKDGYVVSAVYTPDWLGWVIVIDHGGPYNTLYAHASDIHVEEGQFVRQGEHIADVGATGDATGPHLHFEIRIDAVSIDPLTVLMPEVDWIERRRYAGAGE